MVYHIDLSQEEINVVYHRRRSGQKRKRWLDGIMDSMNMSLSKLQKMVKGREAWCVAVHEVAKDMNERLNNDITLIDLQIMKNPYIREINPT